MFGDKIVIGQHTRKVDSKLRVIIPQEYGTEGGEDYFLIPDKEHKKICLFALKTLQLQLKEKQVLLKSYDPETYEKKQKEFDEFFESILYGGKIDKDHRIRIPRNAAEIINVEPGDTVNLVGYGDHVRISNKK